VLVEAFAVAREASWRVLELRHFDVQVSGCVCVGGLVYVCVSVCVCVCVCVCV
jgi:SecA DEAD-like domain